MSIVAERELVLVLQELGQCRYFIATAVDWCIREFGSLRTVVSIARVPGFVFNWCSQSPDENKGVRKGWGMDKAVNHFITPTMIKVMMGGNGSNDLYTELCCCVSNLLDIIWIDGGSLV